VKASTPRPTLHLKTSSAPRRTFYLKRRFCKYALHTNEFINRVQTRAPDSGVETARDATYATLETIGQYLSPYQARRMTARLPRELAESAQRRAGQGGPTEIGAFYAQIADRANLLPEEAIRYAQAVTSVLRQAVPEAELADAVLKMPPEFDELIG
jgi:uncharacterized protein (DUF2267 family)